MPRIRILHASDLHISFYKNMVSPVDEFHQLLAQGLTLTELSAIAYNLAKAYWKKMAASSYDPTVLHRLAFFIYLNAKERWMNGQVVFNHSESIDAVLLSGDLATRGTVEDIQRVDEFLNSRPNPSVPYENDNCDGTLAAVMIPKWILPGNHDRFRPSWGPTSYKGVVFPKFFEPGDTTFDGLKDFTNTPARELGALPDWDTGAVPLRVVVLGADFSLRDIGDSDSLYGWLAQGYVYPPVLDQLIDKTKNAIANHKSSGGGAFCLLWALHFPPGYPHIAPTNRLKHESLLIKAAFDCGVHAVLAGHTHEQVRYRKPGTRFDVLCCGSTTQYVPPNSKAKNRFQIINIESDDSSNCSIKVENYRYMKARETADNLARFSKE